MSAVTVSTTNAFTLAACAEMIYLDMPFMERVEAIASRGLGVEIWDWTSKDLDALASRRADGVRIVSMTGYIEGDLTTDDGVARMLATAEQSLSAAEQLECPVLNFHGTGLGEGGIPVVAPTRTPVLATGCVPPTPAPAWQSWGGARDVSSPWRTSTCRWTTPALPSPWPRTSGHSSAPSTTPTSG